jgi:hypothetical protein
MHAAGVPNQELALNVKNGERHVDRGERTAGSPVLWGVSGFIEIYAARTGEHAVLNSSTRARHFESCQDGSGNSLPRNLLSWLKLDPTSHCRE